VTIGSVLTSRVGLKSLTLIFGPTHKRFGTLRVGELEVFQSVRSTRPIKFGWIVVLVLDWWIVGFVDWDTILEQLDPAGHELMDLEFVATKINVWRRLVAPQHAKQSFPNGNASTQKNTLT